MACELDTAFEFSAAAYEMMGLCVEPAIATERAAQRLLRQGHRLADIVKARAEVERKIKEWEGLRHA